MREQISANKVKLGRKDALALAKEARSVHVAKGKKVTVLDPAEASSNELATAMLGPTGNLRAPTIVVGKRVLVGFHADVYDEVFG